MGVAVLHPQDILKSHFSRNTYAPHLKYPRNPNACLNKQKKLQPNNRRRRSPPRPQANSSPPVAPPLPPPSSPVISKGLKKKTQNINKHETAIGQVRILKRGEEIAKTNTQAVVEVPDLGSTSRLGPDPVMVSSEICLSDTKSMPASFYAGPVTLTSPPPSDVPLPAFCAKKTVSVFKNVDATTDLIRILRLEI